MDTCMWLHAQYDRDVHKYNTAVVVGMSFSHFEWSGVFNL